MADFEKVLRIAQNGYHNRKDYPPFALSSGDDRTRWTAYLKKIDKELSGSYEEGYVAGWAAHDSKPQIVPLGLAPEDNPDNDD